MNKNAKDLMDEVNESIEQIKKYLNKERQGDKYLKLCSLTNLLGDTILALSYYLNYGLIKAEGGIYLNLYGLAQCIKFQQQIVKIIYQMYSIKYESLAGFNNGRIFFEEILNMAIDIDKAKFLTRATITNESYDICTTIYCEEGEVQDDHATKYREAIIEHLNQLNTSLKRISTILR